MRVNVVVLCLVLVVTGCAGVETSSRRGGSRVLRQRAASVSDSSREARRSTDAEDDGPEEEEDSPRLHRRHPERMPWGTVLISSGPGTLSRQAVEMGLLEVDAFETLLVRAGLEDLDELPVRHNPFTPEDAVEVLGRLMQKPVTLDTFPTRMAAGFLLREVLERGDVSREELVRRVARFAREQVAVLRPDGYLAWALDGSTQQKVAPVEWKDGAFRAGRFELGRFYSGKGGVFRAVDARLQASDWRPLAEVYDDADVINRSLDGAEDAFVALYHALGQVLSRPRDSLVGLSNLPAGVAVLIASSPAYWERFQSMTEGEQIREVARLTTGLLVTWGVASATTRTLTGMVAGAEATVPVLSLSAEGALVLEHAAVPVGRAASVLSGGPGAAIILQRVDDAAGSGDESGGGPKAYASFKSFKRAMGPAGEGKEWHHIVEQTDGNVARFGPKAIHNVENVIPVDEAVHRQISGLYSSIRSYSQGKTVRTWLSTQSLEAQRMFGLKVLRDAGVTP
ncbi:hypothetical protein D7V97_30430 [Corallococcus sp. CA053C]|uniref:hypothetical protein n=1 Tax=Corallococcus sp. CA053C TaxID=2316732 RepID=UPI000EA3F5EA|nr:hypothetical protein [Corallococcus sp. CA053C]RKH00368.1 hypothetical protein D7V97_30430 [Corallococcus sp. CA053C]